MIDEMVPKVARFDVNRLAYADAVINRAVANKTIPEAVLCGKCCGGGSC